MVRTTSDKKKFHRLLRIFQGQITVVNDYDLCNKSAFFNPLLMTLLDYTEDEPNFQQQNNLILQKRVVGVDKVVNFKDVSRPNKEIKYFSRTLTEFKDFSRWLVKFNDLYKIIQTMLPLKKINSTENTNLGGTRPLSTIPSPISLTCNFPPFWSKMRCYGKQITLQLIIVHKQSQMPHFLTKSLLNQTKRGLWKQRKW